MSFCSKNLSRPPQDLGSQHRPFINIGVLYVSRISSRQSLPASVQPPVFEWQLPMVRDGKYLLLMVNVYMSMTALWRKMPLKYSLDPVQLFP